MTGGRISLILIALLTVGGLGYGFGKHGVMLPDSHAEPRPAPSDKSNQAALAQPSEPVVYYKHPDKPMYSHGPRKTEDGRSFEPVYASQDLSFEQKKKPAPTAEPSKKLLYYRNPMGLPDTSRTPKKDSMGMDYIPVYEGEDDDPSSVTLSPGKIQRSGVRSEPVRRQAISVPVRAPGTIQLDERRVSVISLRTEAFVEKVEDVTTGTIVKKGQALMRIYSPTIASVAAEYLSTLGLKTPAGTRQRLANLDVPLSLIEAIETQRKVPLTLSWPAPRNGVILERNVQDGMRTAPGDVLFRIADLSLVWALVDVAERDLASVSPGQPVEVRVRSYPNRSFAGKVALLYPGLNAQTRTVRVRVELPNPDLILKPDMYAEVVIDTGTDQPVLSVPDNAIIDSGAKQVVLLDKGEGRFEPRAVELGRRGNGFVEILSGVSEGDKVVTSANFLIDAESNLKAALSALDAGGTK